MIATYYAYNKYWNFFKFRRDLFTANEINNKSEVFIYVLRIKQSQETNFSILLLIIW
jgi:hypothetical protein